MILDVGNRVLVVHRRMFEGDKPRFFVGHVEAYDMGIARVTGTSWILDSFRGKIIKKPELRTKVFSFASGTLIVYRLPHELEPNLLKFEYRDKGTIVLTDGKNWSMDFSENHPNEKT